MSAAVDSIRSGRVVSAHGAGPGPAQAIEAKQGGNADPAPWRVTAVVPCFNRRSDVAALLGDLARLRNRPEDSGGPNVGGCRTSFELRLVLVDNASDEPLSDLPIPAGLRVDHLRLDTNTGGSGGFNAGLARALAQGRPGDPGELFWMLDSDVRVEPDALAELIGTLAIRSDLAAAGSVLVDPATGEVFEAGGRVNRSTGELEQPVPAGGGALVECEYLAACSLLARRTAVEAAGLMSDVFVNGDDVEWSLRLTRATGGRLAAVPASRVRHPHHDRMRTWARYYAARNAFAVLERLGAGGRVRLRRAVREVGRALGQALVGRDDLAELHLAGLKAALDGPRTGPAPKGSLRFEPFRPIGDLRAEVQRLAGKTVLVGSGLGAHERAALDAAGSRTPDRGHPGAAEPRVRDGLRALTALVRGPRHDVALVSARARPSDWLAGRTIVTIAPEGFVARQAGRWVAARHAASVLTRGLWLAARLAASRGRPVPVPPAPQPHSPRHDRPGAPRAPSPTVSVIVLSYNRWPALAATLQRLGEHPALRGAEVIVVDNASTDGTRERFADRFPRVRLLAMDSNAGVAGFNRGAAAASGEALLILDDDAWPAEGALEGALDVLARRPDVAAVALHPRHPSTGTSEWPFAEGPRRPRDDWPVMGCANLVRREAWDAVGGYEEAFFLYRNDVDLALKLLGSGRKVWFDPSWTAWHDSPAGAGGRKSDRWFELATRNWVWLCRRHGRGPAKWTAIAVGWAWAHRLAGLHPRSHARVAKGVWTGLARTPPPVEGSTQSVQRGRALASFLRLRF